MTELVPNNANNIDNLDHGNISENGRKAEGRTLTVPTNAHNGATIVRIYDTVPTNERRDSDDTVYEETIAHVYDNSISYIDSEIHIDGDTRVYRNGHTTEATA